MRWRKIVALTMLALMAFPSLSMVLGTASLTVLMDSESYEPGEEVEITGIAEPDANVTVIVNGTQETIYNITISADEDGEYSTKFTLPVDASEGLYNVTASTDGVEAETFFVVMTDTHDGEEMTGTELETSEDEEDDEDEIETVEEAAERAIGLRVAIERAKLFKQKIEAIITQLTDNGFEIQAMAEIQTNIEDAGILLDGALVDLKDAESYDADTIAQNLAAARGILGRTWGHLHNTSKNEVKAWKTEKYIQNMEKHIQSLEAKIEKLQDRITNKNIALTALRNAESKLQRIRERIEAGDVEGAIDDLEDTVEEIDDEVEDLNGQGTSTYLSIINRLEAKIRVLNATANRLAKKGIDTSDIEQELLNAETQLSEMMAHLEEGDIEAAEAALEEVEGHLNISGEIIRNIIHQSKAGKGRPD